MPFLAFFGGLQKYFIPLIVGIAALAVVTAFGYRASYLVEHTGRVAAQAELAQARETLAEQRRTSGVLLQAANQAILDAQALNQQRVVERERIIRVPDSKNGPVAPVLRCAVSGVC